MRRSALPLLFLVACASAEGTGEHSDRERSQFTSAQATLLDFELDGQLVADTNDPGAVRSLVEAQLLFTVGQLNGERSVGELGRLELSDLTTVAIPPPPPPPPDDAGVGDGGGGGAIDAGAPGPDAGVPAPAPAPPVDEAPTRWTVSYHARLPVAWGGPTTPTSYTFTLPKSMSVADQQDFATKYLGTCADPTIGDAGHMFIAYRPRQSGCTLAADDVVDITATVAESTENTHGKYPEYHRLWADGVLRIVTVFSRELPAGTPGDGGVQAYDDFLYQSQLYLAQLQPDAAKRSVPAPYSSSGVTKARVAAELPDGRTVRIDATLVSSALADDGPAFDGWFNLLTPTADVVLYNGHAGLGANVRTLMAKGVWSPRQYLIWFANGCDTFAYVDRTLVDRRALVNPEDPDGTHYMDVVTNVMAGYFGSLEATSMTFLKALVDVRDPALTPKTYEQIFASVDPEQMVVVSGEEDNQLEPLPAPPPIVGRNPDLGPPTNATAVDVPAAASAAESPPGEAKPRTKAGCDVGGPKADQGAAVAALAMLLGAVVRRRGTRERAARS